MLAQPTTEFNSPPGTKRPHKLMKEGMCLLSNEKKSLIYFFGNGTTGVVIGLCLSGIVQ